ncbi:MAG: hypothetical protein AMJ42_00885 [Deltaproteobacteria bacterium DG_8]|nr:MAG: hypothetical protein AMJ42_00885 [Deltaproteobacteria bacterium DG_8]
MRKKDFVVYISLLVFLTVAISMHLSIVNNRPTIKPLIEFFKKTVNPTPAEQFETKTKVTLNEIKEIPKERNRRSFQEHESKIITKKAKDIKEKRLSKEVTISEKLLHTGKEMVGNEGEKLGKYPSFIVDYRKTLGFRRYARSLLSISGRFFIMDMNSKKLKAEIDIASGRLIEVGNLKGLSPRSRNISNESETDVYIRAAQKKYGQSGYSVVLLLPLTIDSMLVAGMEESLKEINLNNADFYYFKGLYKEERDGLILNIISGRRKDGKTLPLDIAFNLSKMSMI